jgi:hypothetical protein
VPSASVEDAWLSQVFLGPLKPLVTDHAVLTLEWSHGFIRSAVLRAWGTVQADELLTWLLELPVARFLRSLEVELRSFVSRDRPCWRASGPDESE